MDTSFTMTRHGNTSQISSAPEIKWPAKKQAIFQRRINVYLVCGISKTQTIQQIIHLLLVGDHIIFVRRIDLRAIEQATPTTFLSRLNG